MRSVKLKKTRKISDCELTCQHAPGNCTDINFIPLCVCGSVYVCVDVCPCVGRCHANLKIAANNLTSRRCVKNMSNKWVRTVK